MQGVIAAGHPQTAAAGAEILRQGGNAVDAGVAAAFASFVTELALVNIGGGGIAQVYNPATGQAEVYDFFSTMPGLPANGTAPSQELDFRKILVDFGAAQQPFYIGRGSVAVPGVVAGLGQLVAEKGTLPLSDILAPAIRLARQGVVLSAEQAYITGLLTPILTDTPGIAAIYAPQGHMVGPGQRLRFLRLAETLERLGQEGPALFYTGAVAQQILADQKAHGGLLTETDLATYQVLKSTPIRLAYRGDAILLPPPSSGGGALIAFALKLLAGHDPASLPHNRFEHLRLLAEVMRLTNLARAEWEESAAEVGIDPGPEIRDRVNTLLSAETVQNYAAQLRRSLAGQAPHPEPIFSRGPSNTTHISIADRQGMVLSITTSAGESAGFVVGDTGVALNNMLGEIDLHPQGFHRLQPGQRLMTMMSPTLALRHNRPILAVGSGGSNRLRSAILQVISNLIDFQLPLAAAVDAPRLHFEAGQLQLEGGIEPAIAERLSQAGYQANLWPARNMFFGGAHAVARAQPQDQAEPPWTAAGDRRRGGSVVVI